MSSNITKSILINIAFRLVLIAMLIVGTFLLSIVITIFFLGYLLLIIFGYLYKDDIDNTYKVKIPLLSKILGN